MGTEAHLTCYPELQAHFPVGLREDSTSPAFSKYKCLINGGAYYYYLLGQGNEGKSPWGSHTWAEV